MTSRRHCALRALPGMPAAARVLFALAHPPALRRLEIVAPGGQSFSFPGARPAADATLELQRLGGRAARSCAAATSASRRPTGRRTGPRPTCGGPVGVRR